jgi:GTPase SAR1 family protein
MDSTSDIEANFKEAASQEVNGTESLYRIADIARLLGEEATASEAVALAERSAEGRFYVACIGQFKRGKSTLLGALVGDPVLPAGVTPITSVPTVLRYGNHKSARVSIDGTWNVIDPNTLREYVSEECNPENAKHVEGVEVFVPSPLLAEGMCLVDTPGIGSVFLGNTEATKAFIPHIDAVVVVVGADPPITADELSLVEEVAADVKDLIVVLNKVDRVTEEERVRARSFTKKTIETRIKRPISRIFDVSALESLEGTGPSRDWEDLIEALNFLSTESGRRLVKAASERGVRRLKDSISNIIEEKRRALLEPVEVSEARIKKLHTTVSAAEQSLNDLGFLFSAEQSRLSRKFEDSRNEFLKSATRKAHSDLEIEIAAMDRGFGPNYRIAAMSAAQVVARRFVLPWLEQQEKFAEEGYKAATTRFVELGNNFLCQLAASGAAEMANLPGQIDAVRGFETKSGFIFHEFISIARPASPFRYLGDVLLGIVRYYRPIVDSSHEFLDKLLETNSSRVQSDVDERVLQGRRLLEGRIRKVLRDVSGVAERALSSAKVVLAEGAQAVDSELKKLEDYNRQLAAVNNGHAS